MAEELGDRRLAAEVHLHLGDTYEAIGDTDAVRESRQQALDILDEFDDPDAQQVRAALGDQWNPAPGR
jgi:hypothetical protein